jgi:CheY-like chemotaxis protein
LNESSTLPAKTSPRVPVLVVEDDREQREALCAMLDLEGFAHEEAGNGREALDYLDAFRAPCLILLDVEMPVMNGLDFRVIQLADERLARIPVVVVTANDRGLHARFPGVAGFLSKPLEFAKLAVILDRVCSRTGTVLGGLTPSAA